MKEETERKKKEEEKNKKEELMPKQIIGGSRYFCSQMVRVTVSQSPSEY